MSHPLYSQAALRAAEESLKGDVDVPETESSSGSVLDTFGLSHLLEECRIRDETDHEMDELLSSYLKKRQDNKNPWLMVKDLTATAITLDQDHRTLQRRYQDLLSEKSFLTTEIDRLRESANSAVENKEHISFKASIREMKQIMSAQDDEVTSLRAQRNLLESNLEKERSANLKCDAMLQEYKSKSESLAFEIGQWKKITEKKTYELGSRIKQLELELELNKKQRLAAVTHAAELEQENITIAKYKIGLEYRMNALEEQLETNSNSTCMLEESSGSMAAKLSGTELELAQSQSQIHSLQKKISGLTEENNDMQQRIDMLDNARINIYSEHEEKVNQLLRQNDQARIAERKFRNDAADLKMRLKQKENEFEDHIFTSDERIRSLEVTISTLMNNMKTLGNMNRRSVETKVEKVQDGNVATDQANLLRAEIEKSTRNMHFHDIERPLSQDSMQKFEKSDSKKKMKKKTGLPYVHEKIR